MLKKMKHAAILAGLVISTLPAVANASNFGDLPAVLPFFWLGVLASFVFALKKAIEPKEEGAEGRFNIGTFIGFLLLGIFASFVLLVILFFVTL